VMSTTARMLYIRTADDMHLDSSLLRPAHRHGAQIASGSPKYS
jgi:hypothetical protein